MRRLLAITNIAATAADLEQLYSNITDKASTRFDEGAANLVKMNSDLLRLQQEIQVMEPRLRKESGEDGPAHLGRH